MLLFLGFWNKKLGIIGALGSCVTFICTATIIPFMPNSWAPSADPIDGEVAPSWQQSADFNPDSWEAAIKAEVGA